MSEEKTAAVPLSEVLTDAELRRLAYGKSYYRGESCLEEGAVESLSEFGGRLAARRHSLSSVASQVRMRESSSARTRRKASRRSASVPSAVAGSSTGQ